MRAEDIFPRIFFQAQTPYKTHPFPSVVAPPNIIFSSRPGRNDGPPTVFHFTLAFGRPSLRLSGFTQCSSTLHALMCVRPACRALFPGRFPGNPFGNSTEKWMEQLGQFFSTRTVTADVPRFSNGITCVAPNMAHSPSFSRCWSF